MYKEAAELAIRGFAIASSRFGKGHVDQGGREAYLRFLCAIFEGTFYFSGR